MASRTKSRVPFPPEPNSKHRNARTMDAQTLIRISGDPAFSRRVGAQADNPGSRSRRSWEEDYGARKQVPDMDAKRLRSGGGRSSGNPGRGVRQRALVSRPFTYLRSQVMGLCPGYRVFVLCCGVGAGIVVMRGVGVFY